MRSIFAALVALSFAAACGDNIRPGLTVETRVSKNTLAAGERVDARCLVIDPATEDPALDENGAPLQDTVELVVNYQHSSSFSTDDEGQVIAAKAGTATVRCAAPSLGLLDREPETIEIVAGPAFRVVTELAKDTALAGETVNVACLAFDMFDNPVTGFAQSIALTPFGAGTTAGIDTVRATIVGEYEATCVVANAASVEEDHLLVLPALPASIVGSLTPERAVYSVNEEVTIVAETRDGFGNRVDDVAFAYSSSPNVPSPSEARY